MAKTYLKNNKQTLLKTRTGPNNLPNILITMPRPKTTITVTPPKKKPKTNLRPLPNPIPKSNRYRQCRLGLYRQVSLTNCRNKENKNNIKS